jgi:hypothetical protein
MKASRCLTAFAARLLGVLAATFLLVQCSMPQQQAWRYIQTNGLLTYLSSPPFGTNSSYSQRYAVGNAYPHRRSTTSNWYSNWSSGRPNRSYYGATSPSGYAPNNYFSAPSSGSDSSRYVPRSRSFAPSGNRSPSVKLPVEEPSHTPQTANNPPPSSPAPQSNGSDSTPASATENLPYGSAVPGRMNMVNSPYAGKTQLVDVSGMSAGQTVKCPYTGKLFKVPPTQQAANHTESRLESKAEAPKLNDEPKAGDKKP